MNGTIISISGIDGAGKTTQLNLLLEYYSKVGKRTCSIFDLDDNERYQDTSEFNKYYNYFKEFDVIYTRFYLRSSNTEKLLKELLYKKNAFEYSSQAFALFKSCKKDAELWFEKVIIPLYKQGKTFLFDRYFYDEIIYRSLYNLDINELIDEYSNSITMPADFAFYLHLPLDNVYNRNSKRDDIKTSLFNNKSKMNELYNILEIYSDQFSFIKIDGNNSKEYISKNILGVIESNE